MDHCHRVIRRLGFSPFPLTCVAIMTILPIVRKATSDWTAFDPGVVVLGYAALLLLKVLLGVVLLGIACKDKLKRKEVGCRSCGSTSCAFACVGSPRPFGARATGGQRLATGGQRVATG
jgi:hypothetical protein